jgi:hypothetical protein
MMDSMQQEERRLWTHSGSFISGKVIILVLKHCLKVIELHPYKYKLQNSYAFIILCIEKMAP